MNKFYFSFGSDPQFPFYKGWVEVAADTLEKAIEKFRARYPDRAPGIVNCAFWYSQEQWEKFTTAKLAGDPAMRKSHKNTIS